MEKQKGRARLQRHRRRRLRFLCSPVPLPLPLSLRPVPLEQALSVRRCLVRWCTRSSRFLCLRFLFHLLCRLLFIGNFCFTISCWFFGGIRHCLKHRLTVGPARRKPDTAGRGGRSARCSECRRWSPRSRHTESSWSPRTKCAWSKNWRVELDAGNEVLEHRESDVAPLSVRNHFASDGHLLRHIDVIFDRSHQRGSGGIKPGIKRLQRLLVLRVLLGSCCRQIQLCLWFLLRKVNHDIPNRRGRRACLL